MSFAPAPELPDGGDTAWVPAAGTLIAERYRVDRIIGEGGMGAVVVAEHAAIGGKVAIKFLHPRLTKDAESMERFMREARAAVLIRSERVVRVLDVGQTERGLPYIVMDLLEGSDLGRVSAAGPMPIPLAVDCVLQAAEALAEAHAQGIVHRDIKPANLWLTQHRDGSPSVRVLDFGISKLMDDAEAGGITSTRSVFGSPSYMSPEQIRSAKHVDHRTDIWALGVVLFELLAHTLPFQSDNVAGILAAIVVQPPSSLLKHRPDAPPELERVIRRCLEKDPAKRCSLAALADGLRPFASAVGRIAADRISRVGAPIVPIASIPPPIGMTSDLALGKTEPSVSPLPESRSTRAATTIIAVGLLVGVLGIGVGGTALYFTRTATPTPTTPLPEPPPQAQTVLAPAAPTPTPEPVPSAVPSASVSVAPRPTRAPATTVTHHRPEPAASTPAPSLTSEGRQ